MFVRVEVFACTHVFGHAIADVVGTARTYAAGALRDQGARGFFFPFIICDTFFFFARSGILAFLLGSLFFDLGDFSPLLTFDFRDLPDNVDPCSRPRRRRRCWGKKKKRGKPSSTFRNVGYRTSRRKRDAGTRPFFFRLRVLASIKAIAKEKPQNATSLWRPTSLRRPSRFFFRKPTLAFPVLSSCKRTSGELKKKTKTRGTRTKGAVVFDP